MASDGDESDAAVATGTETVRSSRGLWIAGAVAVVLAVVIAAAVLAGVNGWAPSRVEGPATSTAAPTAVPTRTPAASPTPTPTPTRTPSPAPTQTATTSPTPAPTVPSPLPPTPDTPSSSPAQALAGECSRALSVDEVTTLIGAPVTGFGQPAAPDPGLLGGLSCVWTAEDRPGLRVAIYPVGSVPADVLSRTEQAGSCGAMGCDVAVRFGDAWVYASGSSLEQVIATVSTVGPRAALQPGVTSQVPAGAWTPPRCEQTRGLMAHVLQRADLTPHAGDTHPHGLAWDVLAENGAASWCAALGDAAPGELYLEQISVTWGPGASSPDQDALERAQATPATVVGAREAWFVAAPQYRENSVLAVAGGGVVEITARFLDQSMLEHLASELLAEFS
jgi:hypothetical protein